MLQQLLLPLLHKLRVAVLLLLRRRRRRPRRRLIRGGGGGVAIRSHSNKLCVCALHHRQVLLIVLLRELCTGLCPHTSQPAGARDALLHLMGSKPRLLRCRRVELLARRACLLEPSVAADALPEVLDELLGAIELRFGGIELIDTTEG